MFLRKFILIAALFYVVSMGCSADKQGEFTKTSINSPLPPDAYKATILVEKMPDYIIKEVVTEVRVKVRNVGKSAWPAGASSPEEPYNISLSYRWFHNGKPVDTLLSGFERIPFESVKTPLPYDLRPGQEATLYAKVITPPSGLFTLEFDMLQQGTGWFGKMGSSTARQNVRVLEKW